MKSYVCLHLWTNFSERGHDAAALLVDLAFTFSPLVEQTGMDTVVLDVAGQELLFGSPIEFGPSLCWLSLRPIGRTLPMQSPGARPSWVSKLMSPSLRIPM